MRKQSLKILLVDDALNVEEEVCEGLRKIGVKTEIDHHCPRHREQRFGGCHLPAGREFDGYDLALVDLELFPLEDYVNLIPGDLRGGYEILPYIRREAPWLPVIGYSQHFKRAIERFLPIACSFGFDGYLPRGLFRDKGVTQALWDEIYTQAKLVRSRSILGETFSESAAESVEIACSVETRGELDRRFANWEPLLRRLFHFVKRVVLEPLRGGWSGAAVFRAFARQAVSLGEKEGQWLVKISLSPGKLHEEVQAHLRMMRSGMEYARNVQLLWAGTVVEDAVGAIAYQFALGTQEAAELLVEGTKDARAICERVAKILNGFYGVTVEREIGASVLRTWSPSAESLLNAVKKIEPGATATLLHSLAMNASNPSIDKAIQFHQSLIHGDLHLGNIMLGERDVLIDFARSKVGPLAVDVGRLATDFVIRVPALREAVPTIRGSHGPFGKVFKIVADSLNLMEDDYTLAELFFRIFLAQHLNYESVPADTKNWIISVLKENSFSQLKQQKRQGVTPSTRRRRRFQS